MQVPKLKAALKAKDVEFKRACRAEKSRRSTRVEEERAAGDYDASTRISFTTPRRASRNALPTRRASRRERATRRSKDVKKTLKEKLLAALGFGPKE